MGSKISRGPEKAESYGAESSVVPPTVQGAIVGGALWVKAGEILGGYFPSRVGVRLKILLLTCDAEYVDLEVAEVAVDVAGSGGIVQGVFASGVLYLEFWVSRFQLECVNATRSRSE